MIAWLSSWAGSVVASIIVCTIIELVLPNNSNKKYARTVIGIYILFTILSPIITKISSNDINIIGTIDSVISRTEYEEISENSGLDTTENIKQIYKNNIEQDIISKLKQKGYDSVITAISINFIDGEDYGKINQLNIKINEKIENENEIKVVENVNIDLSSNSEENIISKQEQEKLKNFISSEYNINTANIIIM